MKDHNITKDYLKELDSQAGGKHARENFDAKTAGRQSALASYLNQSVSLAGKSPSRAGTSLREDARSRLSSKQHNIDGLRTLLTQVEEQQSKKPLLGGPEHDYVQLSDLVKDFFKNRKPVQGLEDSNRIELTAEELQ